MTDRYQNVHAGLNSPATYGFSITPDNATDLEEVTRAIYVGTGGDVAVTMATGASVTFVGVSAGAVLPIRAARVLATATTASNLLGLV